MTERRRWKCRSCSSTRISAAFEWAQSVESIDQESDEIGPDNSGPGEVADVLRVFCENCGREGDAENVMRRVSCGVALREKEPGRG